MMAAQISACSPGLFQLLYWELGRYRWMDGGAIGKRESQGDLTLGHFQFSCFRAEGLVSSPRHNGESSR